MTKQRKYTAGPWACGPDSAFLDPPRATFDVAYTRAAWGDPSMTDRREMWEANARVIAAAPDLADALASLLWCIDAGYTVIKNGEAYDAQTQLALEAARAAIAKV